MARRTKVNETGIARIDGIVAHQAWIGYTCINCKVINYIMVEGDALPTPTEAYNDFKLLCSRCGFIHSKDSSLPYSEWPTPAQDSESTLVKRYWEGFFRCITEKPESYYKQCNTCGSILPASFFSKHKKWGLLEKQMECRACKGAINSLLNPQRTKQQLHESSVRRRVADLMAKSNDEYINIDELFDRFDSKCFKTKQTLNKEDRETWAIDHILPSKHLYPLRVNNAALLSKAANENKRDKWPSEFYNNTELVELAKITGGSLELFSSPTPILNRDIDVNNAVSKYLTVRDHSNLNKRISEIKKIIEDYNFVDLLSKENKELLGIKNRGE